MDSPGVLGHLYHAGSPLCEVDAAGDTPLLVAAAKGCLRALKTIIKVIKFLQLVVKVKVCNQVLV